MRSFLTLLPLCFLTAVFALDLPQHRLSSADEGISQGTYDDLVRYAKYSSAVYQFICPHPIGNTLVDTFSNHFTHAHGFVVRDDDRKELIVAFRGSQQLQDMVTDSNLVLAPLSSHGVPPETAASSSVHAGFMIAYNSVSRTVISAVREELDVYPDYTVIVTGHSMGGSLASIASLSLKVNLPEANVRLFTYGQPRTGDSGFADLLDDVVGRNNLHRAVHTWDGVPTMVPQYLGYRHHANEFWQFEDPSNRTNVRKCSGQEDPACSRANFSTGINAAHFVYFGQVMTVDSTLCL
ncbi:alpha/beta-hydrolase [Auriscalpium vulgare]|uniref:Alpha/beta-hydrolase n=1 Tax=Auriscalpium vulgare TaxID=40419 RepID=A0ACB8RWI6_9AGAM|nr:alpha/beta-hydrolase [Auriscalpium vulgare]